MSLTGLVPLLRERENSQPVAEIAQRQQAPVHALGMPYVIILIC